MAGSGIAHIAESCGAEMVTSRAVTSTMQPMVAIGRCQSAETAAATSTPLPDRHRGEHLEIALCRSSC